MTLSSVAHESMKRNRRMAWVRCHACRYIEEVVVGGRCADFGNAIELRGPLATHPASRALIQAGSAILAAPASDGRCARWHFQNLPRELGFSRSPSVRTIGHA